MKKFLFAMVALVTTVMGANAQGQSATLQQGDKMTPFYGSDAFVKAYNAAENGAVITLSAGIFSTVDSITKQVTIIGNGAGDINCTKLGTASKKIAITIDDETTNYDVNLIVNANKVRIEGIYLSSGICLRNVSNTHISNWYINRLFGTHQHKNTVLEQCIIESDYSTKYNLNECYKNSLINYIETRNNKGNNPVFFLNCLLFHWYDRNNITNIFDYVRYHFPPEGVFTNCILGQRFYSDDWENDDEHWQGYLISPIFAETDQYPEYEFYNSVYFLYPYKYEKNAAGNWIDEENDDLKTKEMFWDMQEGPTRVGNTSSTWAVLFDDNAENWWEKLKHEIPFNGNDGTVVGPYGGTGFSLNPSIPRIVESKIDSSTDADGKLNVKIKVEVNQ